MLKGFRNGLAIGALTLTPTSYFIFAPSSLAPVSSASCLLRESSERGANVNQLRGQGESHFHFLLSSDSKRSPTLTGTEACEPDAPGGL